MRNSFSRSDPSHQKIFSGCVSSSISCTQLSTAWFVGFLSPIPFGEMARAMSLMSEDVDLARTREEEFQFSPLRPLPPRNFSRHFFHAWKNACARGYAGFIEACS